MKSIEEMEKAVDTITSYICVGLMLILFLCLIFYVLQIFIGFLVAISIGG